MVERYPNRNGTVKYIHIHATIISEVIKMLEFHRNLGKQLKYPNFDDFWDNLRVLRVQNHVISGKNDLKHLGSI